MFLSASTSNRLTKTFTGSPEGAVTALAGTIGSQTDASPTWTGLWYKASGSGNTGWIQVLDQHAVQALLEVAALRGVVAMKASRLHAQLLGTPTAPTASPGTNTTQLATTAFVTAAITAAGAVAPDMEQAVLASQIFGA